MILPKILFLVFFVFPALVFLFIVIKLVTKSKNASWSGVVTDKKHNEVRDFDNPKKINHFYYLVVKTDQGREMKVGLSQMLWDNFSVGDKLNKPKGKLFPEKVS